MGKRYIKDKDGKFAGSVPDASSFPSAAPEIPYLPKKTIDVESYQDEDQHLQFRETEESLVRWRRFLARYYM